MVTLLFQALPTGGRQKLAQTFHALCCHLKAAPIQHTSRRGWSLFGTCNSIGSAALGAMQARVSVRCGGLFIALVLGVGEFYGKRLVEACLCLGTYPEHAF